MKKEEFKEMGINPLNPSELTVLALYFAACSFMGERVEYELFDFKKGEAAATFTENFSVGLYWPEGLYLHLAMYKQDFAYEILQKYLPMIGNYCISDDPDNLDDDEQFYYTFRLAENNKETSEKLLAICPKIIDEGALEL